MKLFLNGQLNRGLEKDEHGDQLSYKNLDFNLLYHSSNFRICTSPEIIKNSDLIEDVSLRYCFNCSRNHR